MKTKGAQSLLAAQPRTGAPASAVATSAHDGSLMPLASANEAVRAGDHPTAAVLYLRALHQYPDLAPLISGNLDLLRRRLVRTLGDEVRAIPIIVGVNADAVGDECRALCRRWVSLDEAANPADRDKVLANALADVARMVASRPGARIVLSERHLIVWMVAALYQRLWGATVTLAHPTPGLADVRGGMASLRRWLGGSLAPLARVLLSSGGVARAGRPHELVAHLSYVSRPWLAQSELQRLPVALAMLRLGGCVLARAESVLHSSAVAVATFARLCSLQIPEEFTAAAAEAPTVAAAACNILALPVDGLKTLALDYASARRLRLRVDAAGLPEGDIFVIRAYQRERDGECLALVGEAVVSKRLLLLLEFALTDAYSPVLLTATTPDARLIAAALVPFPSLCPGGVHAAEAVAVNARTVVALAALSRQLLVDTLRPSLGALELAVASPCATAAELVFRRDFMAWLDLVFSVRVVTWGAVSLEAMGIKAATSRPELALPPNAFPAMHTLAAARAAGCWPHAESFLLVDKAAGRGALSFEIREPKCLVDRLFTPDSLKRPTSRKESSQSRKRPLLAAGAPLALLHQDLLPLPAIRLLAPIASGVEVVPEFGGTICEYSAVRVVAVCTSVEHGVALAEALTLQERTEILALRLLAPKDIHAPIRAALPSSVALRTRILDCPLAAAVDELAGGDGWLLVLGKPVLPHDARTVVTLCALAAAEDVVAATCQLIACDAKGVRGLGAGYAAFRRGDGSCTTRHVDGALHLPLDVFPVVATGDAVCMTTSSRWRVAREALFGVQSEGSLSLATTRISVQLLDDSTQHNEAAVPIGSVFVMSELSA